VAKGSRRIFRECPCRAAYTFSEWRALERVGISDMLRFLASDPGYVPEPGDEFLLPFEMRNCAHCGSTISVAVPYRGGSDYPPYLKGSLMRYCPECRNSKDPKPDCEACLEERRVQVDSLAREIFVRGVARRNAKTTLRVTYKDQAVEAFVASDDFLDIAEQWAEEGREKMLSRRPERPGTKKPDE
jgi:hypothetical protein